jgi:predicted transcriptional regulator
MKKVSPTTYKIGSIGEFAAWTKRVICDPEAARGIPKKWFDSAATAAAAEQVSAEAMVKLLSPGNLAILDAIQRHKPGSMRELATLTGRTEASLSRTLKRFAQAGIVAFEDGPRRARVPAVVATHVHLDIDLSGRRSGVAVAGPR